MDVFTLMATLSLDSSDYEQKLEGAESTASGFGSKLKSGLGTAGKVAGASIVAVGAGMATLSKKMLDGIKDTASYGDNIDKMSQKLGISAEAYQEWDFIAQHAGTSVEGLQSSMKTLANAVQDDKEGFEQLGISLEDAKNMSQEDLFSAVITGLQGMEAGTERTALASDLLGKSATELGALLNMTAEDTQNMKQQAHDLGGVMSDDAVSASAQYADSLQNLQTAIGGLSKGALSDFLPAVTQIMDGLTAIFGGDDSGIEQLNEGIDGFVNKMVDNLPKILDTASDIVLTILDAIIDNLPKIMDAGFDLLMKLIDGILEALPKLVEKAPEIVIKLVEALIKNAPKLLQSAWEIIKALIQGIVNSFPMIRDAGRDVLNTIKEGFMQKIEDAKTWGKDLIDNFVNGIKEKIQLVKDTVSNVAQTVKDFIGFSEPKAGPLSNFHTYAPDMMELFAQGIRDNERMLTDQVARSFDFGTVGKIDQDFSSASGGSYNDANNLAKTLADAIADLKIVATIDGDDAFDYLRKKAKTYKEQTGKYAFV